MIRLVALCALLLAVAGCGWFGTKGPDVPLSRTSAPLSSAAPPPVSDGQVVVDRVMAVVNQDVITLSELQEAVAFYLRENRQPHPEGDPETRALYERVLHRLVEHRLQVQEAKREKLEVAEEELREAADESIQRSGRPRAQFEQELKTQGLDWEAFRRELRDQLLVQRIVRRRVGGRVSVTDSEVDQYLRTNRDKFEPLLTYRARHLATLATPSDNEEGWERARAKMSEVRRRLESGETFAQVAREMSEDPLAQNGGDLGIVHRGELAPLFEKVILALSVGEISEPVRSPQGLHLFQLEAKEELTGEKLAQAQSQIRDVLFRQKFQERLEAWLEELKRRAIVTIKAEQKS